MAPVAGFHRSEAWKSFCIEYDRAAARNFGAYVVGKSGGAPSSTCTSVETCSVSGFPGFSRSVITAGRTLWFCRLRLPRSFQVVIVVRSEHPLVRGVLRSQLEGVLEFTHGAIKKNKGGKEKDGIVFVRVENVSGVLLKVFAGFLCALADMFLLLLTCPGRPLCENAFYVTVAIYLSSCHC